jgi:hypothetical protein
MLTAIATKALHRAAELLKWVLGNEHGIDWKIGQIEETVSPKADWVILTISA